MDIVDLDIGDLEIEIGDRDRRSEIWRSEILRSRSEIRHLEIEIGDLEIEIRDLEIEIGDLENQIGDLEIVDRRFGDRRSEIRDLEFGDLEIVPFGDHVEWSH